MFENISISDFIKTWLWKFQFQTISDCAAIHATENVSNEGIWVDDAAMGATVFCDEYRGPCYKYDFISYYSSIMNS